MTIFDQADCTNVTKFLKKNQILSHVGYTMILYLGLDPKNFSHQGTIVHYPVIRTEKMVSEDLMQALILWPSFTHVIFTSKTAVFYWEESSFLGKVVIAIGKATAEELRKRGVDPLVATFQTQEGIISLLQTMDLHGASVFLPRSKQSRSVLMKYFEQRQVHYFALDLYDTIYQKLEPVPDLELFEEIVFTSPSTVRGFLEIYGRLPKDKKLTAIGPVTYDALFYSK